MTYKGQTDLQIEIKRVNLSLTSSLEEIKRLINYCCNYGLQNFRRLRSMWYLYL